MTLNTFKKHLKIKTSQGLKIPDLDEDYELVIQEAIQSICGKVIPNTLISSDLINDEPYKWITDTQFVRYPKSTTQNGGHIDIDEQLVYAVVYGVALMYTKDEMLRAAYDDQYRKILVDYGWTNYNLLEEATDECSDKEV